MTLMLDTTSFFSAFSSRRAKSFSGEVHGFNNLVYPTLYKSFKEKRCPSSLTKGRDYLQTCPDSPYGSVFNIAFSPTDSIALIACSHKALVGYDPRVVTTKPVKTVPNAHDDCTNCITFIDQATFTSCSDDKTVKMWDIRNLKACMYTLKGHTNWVKNIEYDRHSSKLFSTAFLDGVRQWDLNNLQKYTSESAESNIVFSLGDPVRMRLSPDGTRMFISLRKNKCVIVDRFDGKSVDTSCGALVDVLLKNQKTSRSSSDLKANRPSVHVMSGLSGVRSFRAVMSAIFHPSSDFIALRHIDVKNNHLQDELCTLYDLRLSEDRDYTPVSSVERTSGNYLKYIDEVSLDESLDFIKEFSFSPDGRVLASPYKDGVRLLAVDTECTPMNMYFDPRFHNSSKDASFPDFEVVGTLAGHRSSSVLACSFAHHDLILGTGCMRGKVLFHKPH